MQRNIASLITEKRALKSSSKTKSSSSNSGMLDNRLKKIADSIDRLAEDDEDRHFLESLRLTIKSFLLHSLIGKFYFNIMLLLNVLAGFEYIYKTYLHSSTPGDEIRLLVLRHIEFIAGLVFSFDWAFHLFLADHKLLFLLSFNSIVDILTIIPIFTTYDTLCTDYVQDIFDYSSNQIINYTLCALQTVRILRALRVRERLDTINDEVQRFTANMILKIVTLILFNSALISYLEYDQNYSFHTWSYYSTVTIATVGYGDITPATDLGRIETMAFIIFAIILVPQMTNELIEMLNTQSIYARARYIPKSFNSQLVLLCGNLQSSALREFCSELFHSDHDTRGLHCVILQPFAPSVEMLALLKDPQFELTVTYLEGSPLNDKDLERAGAHCARAIFIMTNKFSLHPDEEDAKTILQQFSIQKFIRLYSNQYLAQPLFCLQLIRPENKRHLVSLDHTNNALDDGDFMNGSNQGISHHNSHRDLVICLNEIKMGVIAKAVIFPGANTLIMNLLTSFSEEVTPTSNQSKVKAMEGIETLEEDEHNSDWIGEYQRGCDWEIYTTELSPTFTGTTFVALSEILYQKLGIVLFGLEVEEIKKERNSGSHHSPAVNKVYLNPADFVIPSRSDYRVLAFVIAKNKAQSDLTFSKLSSQDSIFNSGMSFSQLSLLTNAMGTKAITSDSVTSEDELPAFKSGKASRFPTPNTKSAKAGMSKPNKLYGLQKGDKRVTTPSMMMKTREKLPWQLLLRRYEKEKTTETIQEEMQRLEDQFLREHYFIRDHLTMDISEAMIRTSLSEEFPYIENHIVIVGKALSNLYDLIRPLRAKSLGILKPIVILYPYDFPVRVWQKIAIFEAVWIIRGSGLEEADLRRCGIFKAKQVVLLANLTVASQQLSQRVTSASTAMGINSLDDADAIFCYQSIRRMNESVHIVVEIVRPSNVGYLDPESGLNSTQVDYKFTPQFASGALFATALLDTLVGQVYYNTKIIDILNRLVGSIEKQEVSKSTQTFYKQSGMSAPLPPLDRSPVSGHSSHSGEKLEKSRSSSPSHLASSSRQRSSSSPTSIHSENKLQSENNNNEPGSSNKSNPHTNPNNTNNNTNGSGSGSPGKTTNKHLRGLVGSSLYQIPLPDGLASRTYGALYSLLAKRKQIPLGILRGVFSTTKSGPKANTIPYVFTNPPKDTELFSCDKIFILSQTPVKITRVTKDDTKEIHLYSAIRSRKKTAEDVLNVVNVLYQDIRHQHLLQDQIEDRVMVFGSDLKEQFVNITQQIDVLRQQIQSASTQTGPVNRVRSNSKDRSETPLMTARSAPTTARLTTRSTINSLPFREDSPAAASIINNQSSPNRVSFLRKRAGSGSFISHPGGEISHHTASPSHARGNSSPATRLSIRSGAGSNASTPTVGAALAARRRVGSSPSPSSSPARLTRKKFEK